MTNLDNTKKHPKYYKYDHTNVSLVDYAKLIEKLDFDEAGNFEDPEIGTVFEYTTRNQYNKRCWWFVETHPGFYRVTGPVPDNEFEVIEAEYRPDMYRHYFNQ